MNYKRGRPKSARAGCKLCKPWKMNGASKESRMRPRQAAKARAQKEEARNV